MITVADILSPQGYLQPWETITANPRDQAGRKAYLALTANLRPPPLFQPSTESEHIFFEGLEGEATNTVWQFTIPKERVSSHCHLIRARFPPVKTLTVRAGFLTPIPGLPTAPPINAQRILVRTPVGKTHIRSHFCPWTTHSSFLMQYHWCDDTPLLHTSTSELRQIQTQQRYSSHKALSKWETQLNCPIPEDLWKNVLLNYGGPKRTPSFGKPS